MAIENIYYTIGQVAENTSLPQSVLRYWETVFDILNPVKSAGGNRRYTEKDIEIIKEIKDILYMQGFTIKGANKNLNAAHGFTDNHLATQKDSQILKTQKDSLNNADNIRKSIDYKNANKPLIEEIKKIIAILDD